MAEDEPDQAIRTEEQPKPRQGVEHESLHWVEPTERLRMSVRTAGSTFPPETTATASPEAHRSEWARYPAAATAPLGSHTSLESKTIRRIASSIWASVTVTTSSTSAVMCRQLRFPTAVTRSPSAIVRTVRDASHDTCSPRAN